MTATTPQTAGPAVDDAVDQAAAAATKTGAAQDPGGWAAGPIVLAFLGELVGLLRPRHVVEFGSGSSTSTLARACAGLEPAGVLTAVENDPVIRRRTMRRLEDEGLGAHAVVHLAPLVVRRCNGAHLPLYHLDRAKFASTAVPEIVLVDGPPSMMGGRRGSVLQALSLADAGSVVLLDDAAREPEQELLRMITESFGDAAPVRLLPDFPRGLAAISVRERLPIEIQPPSVDDPMADDRSSEKQS